MSSCMIFPGPTTANKWYASGFTSLADFAKNAQGYNMLNRQQKVGLKYYDEFQERIPRNEVKVRQRSVCSAPYWKCIS